VFPAVVYAQEQVAQPKNVNESWTATTQTSVANYNPSRMTESYAKSGDRSVDKTIVEVVGPNGRYQPCYETEKETAHVNATLARTVERTYGWDVNGRRNLVQVTEEEARRSANGDAQVIRTTSNSDGNGNLQVIQREVADTRKTSPNAQDTKTTLYRLDGNGNLTPTTQTQEVRERSADHMVDVKTTTLVLDSSGNWEVGEVKDIKVDEDDKNRISEERVSLADSQGRLSEVSRVLGKETETAAGEKSNTVETYFTNLPGSAADGTMHLNRRVMSVQKKNSGGETTERRVEQPNPNDPTASLQVTTKTEYIVQYSASGMQQTTTTQVRDLSGNLNVVSVETRNSDQVSAEQVQIAPSDKPQ